MMRQLVIRSLALAIITSAALAGPASRAATLDILGLGLGMQEAQVDAVLQHQGVPESRISRTAQPCPRHGTCDVTITARTPDGKLTISLIADTNEPDAGASVEQISYTFRGNGMGEPEIIRSAVVNRFGRPDQADPMTWCRGAAAGGSCPPDHPSLRFLPASLTLILQAGSREGGAK